jgi:hypothetical protein
MFSGRLGGNLRITTLSLDALLVEVCLDRADLDLDFFAISALTSAEDMVAVLSEC